LRTQFVFPTLKCAIAEANRCHHHVFRVVHFSVQADHLHLLVEAADKRTLSAGMRGLAVRIARRVNGLVFRRGRFWADRWHGHVLTSPRATRHSLAYVLGNFRKHDPRARRDRSILVGAVLPWFS
jgi:REP element-mobilizing transposase RayT